MSYNVCFKTWHSVKEIVKQFFKLKTVLAYVLTSGQTALSISNASFIHKNSDSNNSVYWGYQHIYEDCDREIFENNHRYLKKKKEYHVKEY